MLMDHPTSNLKARVFFALWPEPAERARLAAWQLPLQQLCGGRVMRGETLHCTLIFVGEIEQSRVEALRLAAREASGETFELGFDTVRYWGHNRIVYAAPGSVPQPLRRLVSDLEQRLARHRFKFDRRAYKPHVTLLRDALWSDAPLPGMKRVCWQIRNFALVQSVQLDGQAGYRVLARFPLASSGG